MRQELFFRPLDNSSSTRLKYELEAQHWQRAYQSNNISSRRPTNSGGAGIVGAVITIAVSLAVLICTFLFMILKKLLR